MGLSWMGFHPPRAAFTKPDREGPGVGHPWHVRPWIRAFKQNQEGSDRCSAAPRNPHLLQGGIVPSSSREELAQG